MVTFLGNPVSFTGKQLQVGDKALDFSLTTTDLSKKSLADFDGKKKVLSVVPSIDTGICSTQTRRFNEELAGLDNTVVLTVSMDLPFAQKRWCGAEGIENAIMLSDYFDHSFGRDYALLINEWHLLARAVFVLDTDNTIRYVEYVDNINSEPNFEAAIAAAKKKKKKSSVTKSSLLFETEDFSYSLIIVYFEMNPSKSFS